MGHVDELVVALNRPAWHGLQPLDSDASVKVPAGHPATATPHSTEPEGAVSPLGQALQVDASVALAVWLKKFSGQGICAALPAGQ